MNTKPEKGAGKSKMSAEIEAENLKMFLPSSLASDKAYGDIPGLTLEYQNSKNKTKTAPIQDVYPYDGIETMLFYMANADILSEIASKPQNTIKIAGGKKFKTLEEAAEYVIQKREKKGKICQFYIVPDIK